MLFFCPKNGVHLTWVLGTEELAGLKHPLLTLVSPTLLENRLAAYDMLRQGGYTNLVVYLAQQIHQFRLSGKEFAMQHLGTEDEMKQAWREIATTLTPEELEDILLVTPVDKRLAGISAEQRLAGIPPEQRLHGLTPEELERLRQLLPPAPGEGDSGSTK